MSTGEVVAGAGRDEADLDGAAGAGHGGRAHRRGREGDQPAQRRQRGAGRGVVAEAMVALVLADAALEKFGGDSVPETRRNLRGYLDSLVIA